MTKPYDSAVNHGKTQMKKIMTDSEFVIRVIEDARHAQSWDIGFLADLDRAIEIMTEFRARFQRT